MAAARERATPARSCSTSAASVLAPWLLRIEALCGRGNGPQARAGASNFLHQFPGSPHADRARSFCADPVMDRPPGGKPSP